MPTDTSHLSEEKQAEMRALDARMLLAIKWGMAHALKQHELPAIVLGEGICEDSVVVVCGAAVYAKMQALQQEAREVFAEGTAEQVLQKARGGV
jgi:hypothetical protein